MKTSSLILLLENTTVNLLGFLEILHMLCSPEKWTETLKLLKVLWNIDSFASRFPITCLLFIFNLLISNFSHLSTVSHDRVGDSNQKSSKIQRWGGELPKEEASPQYGCCYMELKEGRKEVNWPFVFVQFGKMVGSIQCFSSQNIKPKKNISDFYHLGWVQQDYK